MALTGEDIDQEVWKQWLSKYSRNAEFLDFDDFNTIVLKKSATLKKQGTFKHLKNY